MIWYPWLTPAYRQLVKHYSSTREHHALLIQSVPGNAEHFLIQAIGRWLMCQQTQGEKTCGVCHSCRLMDAGTHPDWHILEPEKGKTTLGIDRVRQLIDTLYHYAQQNGRKVVWLPECERLSEAAANALLKTLEEPPNGTYFLLSCYNTSELPLTVRSRCFLWVLNGPDENYSLEWLTRQNAGELANLKTALRLSRGAPLAAQQLLVSEQWQTRLDVCHTLQSAFIQRDLMVLLPRLNQDNAEQRMLWAIMLLMDTVKFQQGAEKFIVNQDCLPMIADLARLGTSPLFNDIIQHWLGCRRQLINITGVNQTLLLTNLLLQTETFFA